MSSKTRLGRINGVALSILGSLALLAMLVWSLRGGEEERRTECCPRSKFKERRLQTLI